MQDDTAHLIECAMEAWQTAPLEVVPGCLPAGSPDRVQKRLVLREKKAPERQFVLEGFVPQRLVKRERQAMALAALSQGGCAGVAPWMKTATGKWHLDEAGMCWQLRKWIAGEPLPRESYGEDAWRGRAAAAFLTAMANAATKAGLVPARQDGLGMADGVFSLKDYIARLMLWFGEKMPALVADLRPVMAEIKPFLDAEATLPVAFCHGDFHPLNVLWGKADIEGVIDWEFCGMKTAMYDVANLMGCLGVDSPEWLTKGFAASLLAALHDSGGFAADAWHWLPELIVAVRFAWMREWCWRKDKAMIVQELDFMWLVLDNRSLLRQRFAECSVLQKRQ